MSAVVRCNDPQPPTLYLNPLPGDQYTAALWAAPIARPRLALPTRVLDDPDDADLEIWAGVLPLSAREDPTPTSGGA